jgi:hypothetical protein
MIMITYLKEALTIKKLTTIRHLKSGGCSVYIIILIEESSLVFLAGQLTEA